VIRGLPTTAVEIAAAVSSGRVRARSVVEAALDRIAARNPAINAFTRVLSDRALREADAVDAAVAAGKDAGPLAGVPFGVKDLFDIEGLPTTVGAAVRRGAAPAMRDAEAIRRLNAAGAVLVGTLNMDEYAYGFATVNAEWGVTRNPHDTERLAGGSSGGSAAAVAAGMVPLTLGSDTNGSIRIPASLCGVYGLKPTHGGLPMQGVFPFADSFDDIGPFGSTAADLALTCRVLSGGQDAGSASRAPRVARLEGWFSANVADDLRIGLNGLLEAFGDQIGVELPSVDIARSAAFLITAAEGGNLHLPALRRDPMGFDPATRDRLMAGAMSCASTVLDAQRFRTWFAARAAEVFDNYDVLIAPTCPDVAPRIDQPTIQVDGQAVPARANLGIYTQPLSFIGLPVVAAPLMRPHGLPLGVQIIGAPGREATLFAVVAALEAAGLVGVTPPPE
jgi:AtzE family amidohydrolase